MSIVLSAALSSALDAATTLTSKVAALNNYLGTGAKFRVKKAGVTQAESTLGASPVTVSGGLAVLNVTSGSVLVVDTISSATHTIEVYTSGNVLAMSGIKAYGPSETAPDPYLEPNLQFLRNFQRVGQPIASSTNVGKLALTFINIPPVATTYQIRSAGAALTNNPLSFVATFYDGEIANYPVVSVAGSSPTYQQGNVLTRYSSGNVREAAIYAQVEAPISSGAWSTVAFTNTTSAPLSGKSKAAMLAALPTVLLEGSTDGFSTVLSTYSVEFRALLNADKYEVFFSGPACTVIRIRDTSGASDVGLDANKSIQPWLWVSFWQNGAIGLVYQPVNGKTSAIQTARDHKVRMKVAGSTVYTSATVYHAAGGSGAMPVQWVNSTPGDIDLDLNILVQGQTGNMMQYVAGTLSDAARDEQRTEWAGFTSAAKEKFTGFAAWLPQMSSVSGRKDFGPQPGWYMPALFTGAAVDRDQTISMAHHALRWGTPWRIECDSSKSFSSGVNGLGKFVTTYGRPTISSGSNDQFYSLTTTGTTDNTGVASPISNLGWDMAHCPNAFQMPWLLTAHPMWLVAMQAWAFRAASAGTPDTNEVNGRGPTADCMSIWAYPNNERQQGWGVQLIANAWLHSIDGTPEKALLKKGLEDCLIRIVAGHWLTVPSSYSSNPMVAWATTYNAWKVNGGTTLDGSALRDISTGAVDTDPNYKVNTCFMTAFCIFPIWLIAKRGFGDLGALAKVYFDWQAGQSVNAANSSRPKILGSYSINIYANSSSGVSGAPRYLTSWEERYVQSGSIDLDTLWSARLTVPYQKIGGYSRFQLGILDLAMRTPGGTKAYNSLIGTEVAVEFPSWKWSTGGLL